MHLSQTSKCVAGSVCISQLLKRFKTSKVSVLLLSKFFKKHHPGAAVLENFSEAERLLTRRFFQHRVSLKGKKNRPEAQVITLHGVFS